MKSLACYVFIVTLALITVFQAGKWRNNDVFVWDVAGYYQYLSSYFIYDDIGDGSYTAGVRGQYRADLDSKYGLAPAPNGQTVMKYPLGMSLFYSPAFFTAHSIATLRGTPADGYASVYQKLLVLVCLAYAMLGLWLLRTVLRRFFEDTTVALTLLAIGLATNFFNYATYESPMAHGTLFLLNAGLLLLTVKWLAAFRQRHALLLGLTLGLMGLVRPTELWMVLVPALWGLTSWAAARERGQQLWQHRGQVLLAALVAVAVLALQPWFWHSVGGAWFIDSYPTEKFDLRHPHFLNGFFSFRKGWLVYTPIMAVALVSIFWLRQQVRAALPVFIVLLPLALYVTWSWWDWAYGGSFSQRPLISFYPLLALPLASFFDRSRRSNWLLYSAAFLLLVCIVLNLTQTWQYYRGILNCCDTTWQMYRERFFWLEWPQPK
ncbi:hypothetical protein J0X19_23265 [Hymenobacter sp. BT186]|uniref:Glycosyltransferase RgtA/B/C/D-like domain-containing protein n=1 Tax=Hymenobacter telluris TaxID=2816474 RepID=A0A939EZU1_9BACT|nr:hypothetical protein [Hymenobacter telluris]MBO0360899.1 hypothetical protein [Hymenobacter telluris]MBW3376928.1 hypothetical protein [Hymenobacter norwichensis]